jgi:hypothetical protein
VRGRHFFRRITIAPMRSPFLSTGMAAENCAGRPCGAYGLYRRQSLVEGHAFSDMVINRDTLIDYGNIGKTADPLGS